MHGKEGTLGIWLFSVHHVKWGLSVPDAASETEPCLSIRVFCTYFRCFFPGFALDFTAFLSFSFSCFFFHATATWKERSSSACEWSLGSHPEISSWTSNIAFCMPLLLSLPPIDPWVWHLGLENRQSGVSVCQGGHGLHLALQAVLLPWATGPLPPPQPSPRNSHLEWTSFCSSCSISSLISPFTRSQKSSSSIFSLSLPSKLISCSAFLSLLSSDPLSACFAAYLGRSSARVWQQRIPQMIPSVLAAAWYDSGSQANSFWATPAVLWNLSPKWQHWQQTTWASNSPTANMSAASRENCCWKKNNSWPPGPWFIILGWIHWPAKFQRAEVYSCLVDPACCM